MRLRGLALWAATAGMAVALLRAPRPAEACGGPGYADLGALAPMGGILDRMMWKSDDFDYIQRDELRFLYPFFAEHKRELGALWSFSYVDAAAPAAAPGTNALEQALAAGDAKAAAREARRVVAAWLALPPVVGAGDQPAAWRAAEIATVAPHLASLSATGARDFFAGKAVAGAPQAAIDEQRRARQAESELRTLEQSVETRIPNGWRDAIQKQVAPQIWSDLEKSVDAWLSRYPKHPLADFVRLYKVRLRYLSGNDAGAWSVLFDVYPRQRVRALAEMRYLLLRDVRPTSARIDALTDPAFVAGFADDATITPERFTRWWKLAERQHKRAASTNLEERLLYFAARTAKPHQLPAGFPSTTKNPTQLWGKLRAAALISAEEWPAARAELLSLRDDPERALLAVHYFVARGRPDLAVQVPQLSGDTREYLLRVLVDDKALARLGRTKGALGKAARFEAGVRLASAGKWSLGAKLVARDDRAQAKLWQSAGAIAASHAADRDLRLARFLDQNRETLFYGASPDMYRAISGRYDPQARTRETRSIEVALERSTARWLALEAYTRWLERNPRDPNALSVLTEADDVYNRLTNWAGGDYLFWGTYAKHTPLVARLRKAGRAVRAP